HIVRGTAKFDLTMAVVEVADGLRMQLDYNTDLFDATTITRLLGHFQTLLEAIVRNPGQVISRLPLLPQAERNQTLTEWNNTYADYPRTQGIHQLFEAQVERMPDSMALVFGDARLTYRELNVRANRLAHHLQSLGVAADVLVGLCVERSLDMVVALLGILKAGGAYVPLDPGYPAARLAFMLQDAAFAVLVTEQKIADSLPMHSARVVCLNAQTSFDNYPRTNPAACGTAESLAYVIYTSGTTGQPKGVQIPHRALVNFLCSMRERPGINDSDVLLAITTLSFDIAALEIFLPLINGARIILVNRDGVIDGSRLIEHLRQSGITILQATPATWRLLIESGWQGTPGLKMLCGGEAMPQGLADQLLMRGSQLWNMYGPTETTVWSTIQQVTTGRGPILIGKPIANTQLYILDRYLNPVPIGVAGDLYIGGDGLARGYLNRPELTDEKFIPHPFTADARLYKTGDLARYLADGRIECLGRIDYQIKIRGFRIELGEIEAVLGQYSAIKEAVVVAREDTPEDKRLVAYVIPRDARPSLAELRAFLKDKLADYMLPSAFVMLNEMPLTPSGKVDRKALPAPDQTGQDLAETYVAPRTPDEQRLAEIWSEILQIKKISIQDNFFELGGHSLLAVRLLAHIEKTLGQNLPLATFFQAPTIEQLAAILCQERWAPSWSSLVPIQVGGSKPPFFCVHGAGGALLHFRDLVRYLGPDQPFYGLQPQGIDGRPATLTKVEEMASFYINELRAFQPEGPYYLGGHCFGGLVALEIAQQLHAQGQQVALLILMDTPGPEFPLELGRRSLHVLIRLRNRIRKRLKLHWQNISRLKFGRKLLYLLDYTKTRVQKAIIRVTYKCYLHAGIVIPHKLRNYYVFDIAVAAIKAYRPKVYSGRITLFWASKDITSHRHNECNERWKQLAGSGVERYDLPATHTTLFYEPQVQVLGERLAECIQRAINTEVEYAARFEASIRRGILK
ncbi:MAG: amino acid adenylation domain-containing protein, partial [Gammaproteobacteria bacterium]